MYILITYIIFFVLFFIFLSIYFTISTKLFRKLLIQGKNTMVWTKIYKKYFWSENHTKDRGHLMYQKIVELKKKIKNISQVSKDQRTVHRTSFDYDKKVRSFGFSTNLFSFFLVLHSNINCLVIKLTSKILWYEGLQNLTLGLLLYHTRMPSQLHLIKPIAK